MSSKSQKVALFGGSFDPIHLGHLSLAIEMNKRYPFDSVLFCPNFCSPNKINVPPVANASHRKKMVELAIEPFKTFQVLDIEIQKNTVCYTIDTLEELSEKFAGIKLFFIMAQDTAIDFQHWKKADQILEKIIPLIGARKGSWSAFQKKIPEKYREIFKKGFIEMEILEISSLDIRKRLKNKLDCAHLLPEIVLDYITKYHLY